MKRPALLVLLVLALLGAFALGGRGDDAAAAPTPEPGERGVVVDGAGEASGAPDVLRLTFGVLATGSDVTGALNQANAQVTRVRAALARHGARSEDVQTSDVSIYPIEERRVRRFQVSEQLTAKLRDLRTAGKAIADAISAGGNGVTLGGVSFALEDNVALLDSARDKAFADARRKAERYAKLAGLSLGDLQLVTETVEPSGAKPYALASAQRAAADVPLYAGTSQVKVRVSVRWALS